MTERIIIAGSGGQGIMLLGKVLAESALKEDKEVTYFPCYGAEVRGGSAYCMVVISEEFIASPYIDKADTLILMNDLSLKKFISRVRKGGIMILNSSLIKKIPQKINSEVFSLAFTENALRLGNIKIANMIALGSYLRIKPIVSLEKVYETLRGPFLDSELKELNKKALELGMNLVGISETKIRE